MNTAVICVPEANNIVIAASHNLVLVRDFDAGHISLVFTLYLFTSYKLMSLRRIRQTKEGNSALPAWRYEPETCLVTTESYIGHFLKQIKRLVYLFIENNVSSVQMVHLNNAALKSND